jgi:hypothetical protein
MRGRYPRALVAPAENSEEREFLNGLRGRSLNPAIEAAAQLCRRLDGAAFLKVKSRWVFYGQDRRKVVGA